MSVIKKTNPNESVAEEFVKTIQRERTNNKLKQIMPLFVMLALTLVFSVAAEGFFTLNNFIVILNQLAIPLVLAVGMTFVILIGSTDLSVEGVMGLCGTFVSLLLMNSVNSLNLGIWGLLIILLMGTGIGFLIGLVHVKSKVPSFLLTYAVSGIATGVIMMIFKGTPVKIMDESFVAFSLTSFLGIPLLTWAALCVFLVAFIVQEFTPFGRYVYALGYSEEVPRSIGINTDIIKITVFGISGFCIAFASILGASRQTWGDISIGQGNLFPTITAVVIGGTPLSGGTGGVVNTLIGVFIVTILNNGLLLSNVSPEVITGLQGIIIIAAVAIAFDRGKSGNLVIK